MILEIFSKRFPRSAFEMKLLFIYVYTYTYCIKHNEIFVDYGWMRFQLFTVLKSTGLRFLNNIINKLAINQKVVLPPERRSNEENEHGDLQNDVRGRNLLLTRPGPL